MVTRRALKLHVWMFAAVVGAALLLAQVPAEAQTWPAVPFPTAQWTVLVYMDGDNNLEQYALMDVNELEAALDDRVTTAPLVNVVVMLDRIQTGWDPAPSWDVTTDGDWGGTHTFRIKHDTSAASISSDKPDTGLATTDMGEQNMGDPMTLANFIAWGARNYPAQHYALVLWDHGGGWRTAVSAPTKDICYDDTDGDYLSTYELQAALALATGDGANRLDVVAMDACLMGMEEVAYAIAPYANYLVASEDLVPGTGLAYDRWLTWLRATVWQGQDLVPPVAASADDLARDIASTYVVSYSGHTQGIQPAQMSVINLARMGDLRQATNDFATAVVEALRDDLTGTMPAKLHTWWECAQIYTQADLYIDVGMLASLAKEDPTQPAVQSAATVLLGVMQKSTPRDRPAVLYTNTSVYAGMDLLPSNLYKGLSIYYPFNMMPDPAYLYSAFIFDGYEKPTDNPWWQLISIAPLSVSYVPDPHENDGDPNTANQPGLGDTERYHWFHYADDSDVFAFPARATKVYVFETSNLGPKADTKIMLLGPEADGFPLLASDDDASGWWGMGSQLIWACPADGTYYAVVVQSDSSYLKDYFGGSTFYDMTIDEVTFSDLPVGSRAFWDVQRCYHAGIVSGFTSGYYLPSMSVRRDQMAAFIARAMAGGEANVPEANGTVSFSDVPSDNWANKYVEYAVANGVVKGYKDGLYHPEEVVRRGQMAVFVARALTGGAIPASLVGSDFTDVERSLWSYDAISYLASQGVVSGFADDTYRAESAVTRDHMAAYIARAFLKK